MSDILSETPSPEPPVGERVLGDLAAAPEPAATPSPDYSAQIAALEQRVASIEAVASQASEHASQALALASTPAPATAPEPTAPDSVFNTATAPVAQAPDWQARITELIQQGMSEIDATEQAAYEERLWNDHHNPVAQVTV